MQIPQIIAQTKDSTKQKTKHFSILPVPAFGYAPETKAYVGAVCLFAFRTGDSATTRTSNAKAEFNYTQRKQFIYEIGWNIFTKNEKYFFQGKLHLSKFPDYFWGTGPQTQEGNKTEYASHRMVGEVSLYSGLGKQWFVGTSLRYLKYADVQYFSGPTYIYRQLHFHEAVGFPGFALLRDTRKNILLPTQGMYFFMQYINMIKPHENYSYGVFDVRRYRSKWKFLIHSSQFKLVASTSVNAFDKAVFGGDAAARGYYAGRYRSSMYATVQEEAKIKIYRRWSVAIFGGLSYIGQNDLRDNSIRSLDLFGCMGNLGTGIRFLIDRKENINLRMDYAFGQSGRRGFYVAFGEAF